MRGIAEPLRGHHSMEQSVSFWSSRIFPDYLSSEFESSHEISRIGPEISGSL